eukprot:c18271_g1_i1 orf=592-2706(+)
MVADDLFPAGLRVMVVDDDPICLLILDRMLRRCSYQVTTFGRAVDALDMLRGHRDDYDLVISDVCMPDMDGFKLLELVGLEMDLPVIMMSANGETSAVMKGIKHGACDYLLKPVRIEELKNIWQHVVRKKWRASQQSTSIEDIKVRKGANDSDLVASATEELEGVLKQSRKRKDIKEEEEDADQDIDDPSGTKKSRVVWSVDLHQQFVAAVNHLGIDKAVPKRILDLMNVQGLTRENIASHLQKYRLYLKRISGAVHHPGGLHPPFVSSLPGSLNPSFGAASAGRFGGIGDLRTLAATGQLSPQTLMSALQAGLLGRLDPKSPGLGDMDSILMQVAALQGMNACASGKPSYDAINQANFQARTYDLKQLAQSSQPPAFAFSLAGSPSNLPVLQQNQRLESAAGLECMGQLVAPGSNLQMEYHNKAIMPELRQHHADGCLADSLISPTRGVQGQNGVVADMEPWASPPSNTNGAVGSCLGIQGSRSFGVGTAPSLGAAGSPSLSVMGHCDNRGPYMTVSNVSSPLATPRLDSEIGPSYIKSYAGPVSEGSLHSLSNSSSTFMSPAGQSQLREPMTLQRNQAVWQSGGDSHELGHTYCPPPSVKLSHASSSGRSLDIGSGQSQAQLHSPCFSVPFAGNVSAEEIMMASAIISPSQTKSKGLSTFANVKEEVVDGMKPLQGLSSPLSEDLLRILFKQHQESLGFTEG